jgi:hypothetical protein
MESTGFFNLVKAVTGDETATHFLHLTYSSSFATGSIDPSDLQQIEAMAGHHCLEFFDKMLNPQSLSLSSKAEIQILFFLLVSSISAISTARPHAEFVTLPSLVS